MIKLKINEKSNIISGIIPFSSDVKVKSLNYQTLKKAVYFDCTFGGGGYSKALLEFPNTKVIGIDRDPSVIPFSKELKKNLMT